MGLHILMGFPEMRTPKYTESRYLPGRSSARASQGLLTEATNIVGRPLR